MFLGKGTMFYARRRNDARRERARLRSCIAASIILFSLATFLVVQGALFLYKDSFAPRDIHNHEYAFAVIGDWGDNGTLEQVELFVRDLSNARIFFVVYRR